MHFKTHDMGILRAAMTGDQSKIENLTNFVQLPSNDDTLNLVESNPGTSNLNYKGGFYDKPFGNENSWWSVGGVGKTWECGDSLSSFDGGRYET